MHCRNCGSETAHRSRRRGIVDWVLSTFQRFPYRCSVCESRFHARRELGHSADPGPAGPPPEASAAAVPPPLKRVKKRKRNRLRTAIRNLREMRREKRARIATQVLIYGLALLTFLVFLYGLIVVGVPGF